MISTPLSRRLGEIVPDTLDQGAGDGALGLFRGQPLALLRVGRETELYNQPRHGHSVQKRAGRIPEAPPLAGENGIDARLDVLGEPYGVIEGPVLHHILENRRGFPSRRWTLPEPQEVHLITGSVLPETRVDMQADQAVGLHR